MRLFKRVAFIGSVFILVFFAPLAASAQANLVGRYVKLNGPFCWDYLGLARTDYAYGLMQAALDEYDRELFQIVLKNYDIVVVEKNVPVVVMDIEIFEARAKVSVLGGLQQGACGWIPLSWIEDSYQAAKLWH